MWIRTEEVVVHKAWEFLQRWFHWNIHTFNFAIMNITDIAKAAHEVNRAYCSSIGDDSQVEWDKAQDWQKESAVKGVQFIIDNPKSTPEQSHESWLKEKEATGWKYGEVKDVEKKEHPCFVPYGELPLEQRVKDHLFGQTVRSLLPHLDKPVEEKKEEEQQLTITDGMKEIDVNFNVGNREDIYKMKHAFAAAWDTVDQLVKEKLRAEYNTNSPTETQKAAIGKINRLAATAKTHTEIGAMLAVKAITR